MITYLTEHEGIKKVNAWCSSGNIGTMRALKNSGMHLVSVEKDAITVGDRTYDKMNYEYVAGVPEETEPSSSEETTD